ncbi:MAG TPA: hypothetical protein VGU23_05035 [Acidobacteriaceae bacterium]|nr:hypothetical protein [Acidobacteriaceae bacterium]
MSWYFYVLEFLGGLFLANGVPHFVHGISGRPFISPFGKPPAVGESSPVSNVLWGFFNFVAGLLLLHFFWPVGELPWLGWTVAGVGALSISILLAIHFAKVRRGKV